MIHGVAVTPSRTLNLAAELALRSPPPVCENLLLNPRFERTEALGGTFRRPTDWLASAFSPVCGVVTAACPAALTRRARHGASVAWLNDSLPAHAEPGPPAALYQTLTLAPGAYRFGGRLALRIWDAALDAVGRRVLSASQAHVRLYRGTVAFDPHTGAPAGVDGTLLGAIDVSPNRFAYGEFRRAPSVDALVRFAYVAFDRYEDTVVLDGATSSEVTLQLVVVPVAQQGGIDACGLVPLTHVTLLADHLFVEPA
ncbi:MAG: hypothetical protein MUE62_06115 [Burkholderiaceae bacterium]|nr:hypothetical protein [Burkholderiaceae bacterium]